LNIFNFQQLLLNFIQGQWKWR